MTTVQKYAIKYKDSNSYLDQWDCETTDIDKAMFFDTYTSALNFRNEIDVAYLYEIIEVSIKYKIIKENIKFNIMDANYIHLHFKKSKELAPEGYEFLCNYNPSDTERKKQFSKGYLLMDTAYNVYGELIENWIAVYRKIIQ